jgi:hypothetical protein
MSNPMDAPPAQTGGRNNNMIIAIVVGVLVLCCCCVVIAVPALWSCGDLIMGTATQCAPLF